MQIRFVTAPNEAVCNTCCRWFRDKEKWKAAVWFAYFGNHNAVPMCARHAVHELGIAWSLGETISVNGQEYGPPAPMAEALQREAQS